MKHIILYYGDADENELWMRLRVVQAGTEKGRQGRVCSVGLPENMNGMDGHELKSVDDKQDGHHGLSSDVCVPPVNLQKRKVQYSVVQKWGIDKIRICSILLMY